MKYFSIDTVVKSYVSFQDCMTNKSWGYLALLKGCQQSISVGTAIEIDLDEVSNFLEDIFCIDQEKKEYNSGKSLNAIFSKKWGSYFSNEGRYSPNIYDVIVWAYRRKSFPNETKMEDILTIFADEFKMPISILQSGFNTLQREVRFSDTLYRENELKKALFQKGIDVSKKNITAQKSGVIACPGEISRGPFVQPLYAGLEITDFVIILQSDFSSLYKFKTKEFKMPKDAPLQQIFYGAPGTGKSFTIKEVTGDGGEDVVRTTFHPDSDYSTFVGAYKPTKQSVKMRDMAGHVIREVNEETGKNEVVMEDRIVYKFVAQSFVRAYTRAWRNLALAREGAEPKPVFLVIEEINRGNCAQIFGDLFQLLDRKDEGFSDYPIIADSDMRSYLYGAMKPVRDVIRDDVKRGVDALYKHGVMDDVINGNILLLPNNLYIWATMNTSDQSLFPIDSAFKRRWDWTYVPISNAKKDWRIEADGAQYDWWEFLVAINDKIDGITSSEDKKLGYFFCKANQDGIVSAEKFVGKVIFYLWNDVFKDYEFNDAIFLDEDGEKLTFAKFYTSDGKKNEVVESKVRKFLENLGLVPVGETDADEEEEDEDDEDSTDASSSGIAKNRFEFWSAFLKYAHANNSDFAKYFAGRKTPTSQQWYDFFIGATDCHLVTRVSMKRGEITVLLYFDKTTSRFYKLLSHKAEIEQELGIQLQWMELPDKKASVIKELRQGVEFNDRSQWRGQFDFIIDRLLRMRATFLKYLG